MVCVCWGLLCTNTPPLFCVLNTSKSAEEKKIIRTNKWCLVRFSTYCDPKLFTLLLIQPFTLTPMGELLCSWPTVTRSN
ncbi:hypothetical protein EXN66_Car009910 [Channa argus]|uniref:Uncharacterized protein n=1 Tax=Channa argus TaxID=215402 RepID=A0A6G1PVR7_CHAAH|nr:hypothetical protein EXN66_Car009910 [Channa argus]